MAKVISQETFDDVVKENIVEFSMSAEEAKDETVKQFEAQGINLANIIKDLNINSDTGKPVINESLEALGKYVSDGFKGSEDDLIKNLGILKQECDKSVPHRVLAVKNGAQKILISLTENELEKNEHNISLLSSLTEVFTSLTNQQPDIFGEKDLEIVKKLLILYRDNERLACSSLQWLAKACIMHEMNRQQIVNADIIKYLKPLVSKDSLKKIRDVCAVFRYLILDDDIRVEFGKAHEHARIIAEETLTDLTKLLAEIDDIHILSDLLLTIASLTVRHEFCLAVEEAGGLKLLLELLAKYPDSVKITRESLKLIRALAGHDTVKAHIVEEGAPEIIEQILSIHKQNETVAKVGLLCISTLTLRSKENSAQFFKTAVPEIIVEVMRLHPKSKIVQRNGAWAIRNMVSRSRDQCDSFLSYHVEEVLNAAGEEHPSIKQDIKAALRDLGCKVELKEEWTGKAEIKIAN